MKFDKVVFYNHYGTGDLFTAREFVREIISHDIAEEYYFAHHHNPYLLSDISGLKHCLTDGSYYFSDRKPFSIVDNTLYFNTWIGYAYGKYVEGIATCTLDNFKRMYNDTLAAIGLDFRMQKDLFWYVPNIIFAVVKAKYYWNIHRFIEGENAGKPDSLHYDHPENILISNGDVQSGQAENFDFTGVIKRLCEDYPNKKIIVTQDVPLSYTNLYSTKNIIQKDGCDLLEISYLSTYCNTIIGRSSGPYVYSQVKDNYTWDKKKFLSFTYQPKAGHMAFWKDDRVKARRYWNDKLDYDIIREVIDA